MARRRPGPVLRAALRLPVLLYRAGLGGLLGGRFLMITHRGRRSGRTFHTVVEVVRRDPATGEVVVSAAWGGKADWLRNILASPALAVTCGRRRFVPAQRLLARPEAIDVLRAYAGAHPAAFRGVLRFVGLPGDADLATVAAALPMVAFRPPVG
jgi:deazaflavin-dependent oxidoreductase (nitroreductase family)